MNRYWKVSLFFSSLATLSLMSACGGEAGQQGVPKDDPVQEECKDGKVLCGETCIDLQADIAHCGGCDIACDVENGEVCQAGSCVKDEVLTCEGEQTACGDTCVDTQTDVNNCGNCNIHCDTEAGESCVSGQCIVEHAPECEDDEPATCEGNAIKRCVNGSFVTEECGDQVCELGACIDVAECDNDMAAICDGNAVKTCENGKYKLVDCETLTCEGGACTEEEFVKECEDTDAPSCDESNRIRTCQAGKYEYQSCGTLTCTEGECQDIVIAECDETFVPVCEENGLKTCVDGKFVTDSCGDGKLCKDGACIATAIEDLCPDDPEKGGPGVCGCGLPDSDLDNNGVVDCLEAGDLCPDDPNKTLPGICGCNIPDTINEASQNPYCLEAGDLCPQDTKKTVPGVCGCDIPDTFDEWTRMPWCNGTSAVGAPYLACTVNAESDAPKYLPGFCGCEMEDKVDEKIAPACESEVKPLCDDPTDTDNDGVADCFDQCPQNKRKFIRDICACDRIRVKIEGKEYCALPIETADEFVNVVADINAKKINNTVNEAYILMNDIDLGNVFEGAEQNWTGVDNFKGKIISKGFKISYTKGNKRGQLNCTGSSCGLFNSLSEAYINNIKVELDLKGKTGESNTGVLAGSAASSHIENIDIKGDVTGSGTYTGGVFGSISATTLSQVKQEGDITSTANYAGGVVGRVFKGSTLTSIESKGNIKGKSRTGGVFGSVEESIVATIRNNGETRTDGENAYTGGISGYSSSAMTDIVSEGLVKGKQYVGGITGYQNQPMTNITNKAKVLAHNYNTNDRGYIGGIAGYISGANKTFKQIKNNGDVVVTCEPFQWHNYSGGISITTWACANVGGLTGAGGLTILEDIENTGNITVSEGDRGTQIGGIVGSGYPKSMKNIRNSGNITGAGDTGGIIGLATYSVNTTYSNKVDVVEYENIRNSGNVGGKSGTYTGGIIGRFETAYEKTSLTVKNVVNSGNITNGQYVGGIFGMTHENGNSTQFTDLYSTGNITGTNHVGGLIGSWLDNSGDCNGYNMVSTGERKITRTLNRAYAIGNVKGNNYVGGLIGSLYTAAVARNITYTTVYCDADKSQHTSQQTGPYFDATMTTNIYNVYALGNVTGADSVGGLFGYVNGASKADNSWGTVAVSYVESGNNPCSIKSVTTPAGTYTRYSKLVLANAGSAGLISGTANLGGSIGNLSYANSLTYVWNFIFNNLYTTNNVPQGGGFLFGAASNPTHIDYKNIFYWSEAGPAKLIGSGNLSSDRIKSFKYETATPVLEDSKKLLDKLNDNITNSTTPELDPSISSDWKEKKHSLTESIIVNLPILAIEPPADIQNGQNED